MYLKDIITLLRKELPKYSDKFSESVAISSISYLAGVVTVVTASDHGLVTGNVATLVDCKQQTPISSISTDANMVATIVTSSPHDLTLDYASRDDQPKVTISGCTIDAYNGEWPIEDITSRIVFSIKINSIPTDAIDGSLLENSVGGFSGIKTITRIDDTTFTFVTDKPLLANGLGGNVKSDFRITRAVTVERFIEAYTKQLTGDYYLVVTPQPTIASKDRNTVSDSMVLATIGDDFRQRIINNFSIYIFIPSIGDISGGKSYDSLIDETPGIFKSLLGSVLPSPYSLDGFAKLILESHQFYTSTKAYYIHQFNFSTTNDLVIDDFNTTSEDVAFRDITYDFLNKFDEIILNNNVELDN